jgi:outer membrane scaffolding protein for murein synthesis (MipA/OmpV family)
MSLAAIALAWIVSPGEALAADFNSEEAPTPAPVQETEERVGGIRGRLHDWKVTAGFGAVYLPEYEGSDEFKVQPFPLLSAQFGERVFLDTDGLKLDVWRQSGFRFAVTGGVDMGREEDDSDYLRGLGDIDPGGVVGGLVSFETGPFEVYASLDKTIGGSEGLTGTIGTKASYRYERFIFSADVSGTWADDKHMESYFGINAAQSARSGLAEYEAGAGFKRLDLKASVTYMWTEHWMVTGAAGTGFLLGDAQDSPIVKDDIQPFAMLGVGYRF